MNIYFLIKTIAFITMCIDHFGFINRLIYCNIIGRISMPLYALIMAIGTRNTKNAEKRTFKLLIVALISTPIVFYVLKITTLNIIFSFFLFSFLFFLIKRYDIKNNLFEIIGIAIIAALSIILNIDYGAYLILLLYAFYKINNCYIVILIFSLLTFIKCHFFTYGESKYIQLYSLLAIPFILCFYKYKDKLNIRTKHNNKFLIFLDKNLFYILYPLHFIVLWFIDKIF